MEAMTLLGQGFAEVLSDPLILLSVLIGCFLGTVVGMLPGLGPSTAIALLIPIAFAFPAEVTLVMVIAMYLGAEFGGRISAILLNIPGDISAMMTTLEGHPMAQAGKAGLALSMSAIASFLGTIVGVVGLTFFAPMIAKVALSLGPSEYFAMVVMAIVVSSVVVSRSTIKGIITMLLGLALATMGTDPQLGMPRFTFGSNQLISGVPDLAVIIGVFGVGEVLWFLANSRGQRYAVATLSGGNRSYPKFIEMWRLRWSMVRGSILGFVAGVLPGTGSGIAAVLSYSVEKRVSKESHKFGTGQPEGLTGPESSNNAAAVGSMVPMLALGIPGSGTAAVLMAYLIAYGLQPGPGFFRSQTDLAWIIVASLYVSAVVLIVLNLPLVPIFAKILKVPAHYLMPTIMVLAIIGGFSISYSIFHAYLVVLFGLIGFWMRKTGFSPVLLVIGMILGSLSESRLRQAVVLNHGDMLDALLSPWGYVFYAVAAAVLIGDVIKRRKQVNEEITVSTPVL